MRFAATDFRANYRVIEPFRLPFHSGSLLRGVLGRALRRHACAEREPCAGSCRVPERCAWSRLFEPPARDPAPHALLRGATQWPPPLVPVFPPPGAVDLARGATFGFGLRHFGFLSFGDGDRLAGAAESLADLPIGGGDDAGRLAFLSFTQEGPRHRNIEVMPQAVESGEAGRMTIQLETPAWIEERGALAIDIDFRDFFMHVSRRLTIVSSLYGERSEADDAEFHRLRDLAGGVRVVTRELKPLRWERHSVESGERHPMRGVLGSVVFAGPLAPFVPWVQAASLTHIGKSTSFGLGRFRMSWEPGRDD